MLLKFALQTKLKNSELSDTLEMIKLTLIFLGFSGFCSCIIYIDRFTVESNPKYANVTVAVKHDHEGNGVTNVTIQTFMKTIKVRLYVKIVVKEDQEYRKELLRTAIDVEKLYKDLQRNVILRNYMSDLKRAMDFELKFPLKPVSVKND